MQISRKYSKKALIKIDLAVTIIVIVWYSSVFLWFKQSDNWKEIKQLLVSYPEIAQEVGKVDNSSLSIIGFSYKTSGEWSETSLVVNVDGSKLNKKYALKAEKKKGVWRVAKISSYK
jgi:hypothetical protein